MLAAPLVLDLARLGIYAKQRGHNGNYSPAACFFKSPNGVSTHDLAQQFAMLAAALSSTTTSS
jgi:myo-inositol-1-phosphate synthase